MTIKKESLNEVEQKLLDYLETHDVNYLSEDAVFKNLNSGEVHRGRAEVGGMLHYMYHIAFEAKAIVTNIVVAGNKAVAEAFFSGRHIGELMGVAATNREVHVPLCLTYVLKDGLIIEGHIYMATDVLRQQLGVQTSGQKPKVTYLVRDIFQLKFGHFKDAKQLLQEASDKNMLPEAQQNRVFSDFTGDAYRLIFEEGYDSLTDYEISLNSSMKTDEWQEWYQRFKPHIERSHREILKQVM
jgi:predicted ester cyclase